MNLLRFLDNLQRDLIYGLRMLRKSPGTSLVAIISLALGIGANTAIFGVLDTLLLKRLPVPHAEQLYQLWRLTDSSVSESFPYPVFEEFRNHEAELGEVFGFALRSLEVRNGSQSEQAAVQLVSDSYFSALGVQPEIGRLWSRDASVGGVPEHAMVISDAFWSRQFARAPSALGATLYLSNKPFTVIGIMNKRFAGLSLDYAVDLWVPIDLQPEIAGNSLLQDNSNWVMTMTRLKPETSVEQAAGLADSLHEGYRRSTTTETLRLERVQIIPADRPAFRARNMIKNPLLFLMGIVALVLLIACANVANLQLARAAARQREFIMRLAVGARRGDLIRQLLTESLLLSLIGGGLGLVVANWGSTTIAKYVSILPPTIDYQPDLTVLAFTAALCIAVALLFGLAPAIRSTRVDLISGLKERPFEAPASGHRPGRRQGLLISQLTLSFVLLVLAGLLVRNFQKTEAVDLGYQPNTLVQLQFGWGSAYNETQVRSRLDQILLNLQKVGGVASSSMCRPGLFARSTVTTNSLQAEGEPPKPDRVVHIKYTTPNFFKTMQITMLRGRDFTEQDTATSPKVVILGEIASRTFFHNEDPIGKPVFFSGQGDPIEVVGVVKDIKLDEVLADPPTLVYMPLEQDSGRDLRGLQNRAILVRTATDPNSMLDALRGAIRQADPALRFRASRVTESVKDALIVQQVGAWITGGFGLLGLLLATIGTYGLQSYLVVQRTHEIGVRMALGSTPSKVSWLVWKQAMFPVLVAIGLGILGSFAATRLLASQLFGLTATDPLTLTFAASILLGVSALAGYLPARRASKINPMIALRHE